MAEETQSNPLTIYTIGHSNTPTSSLTGLLRQHGVQVVLDVRSSPYSQFAHQYNRETLEKSLQEAGLEYRFAGEYLGGRPKDPSCYKARQIPDGKAEFVHLVDYPTVMTRDFFQKGIQRLLEIAASQRTAVLCSEEDPSYCHRHHLIGKYLVGQGASVLHIRADGSLVKDQLLPNLPEEPPATQLKLF